jgi:triosephosphate isomerase
MPEARTPLVAGNWKMNGTTAEVRDFVPRFLSAAGSGAADFGGTEVWLCPPFTALPAMVEAAGDSGIKVAAQNMHQQASGAFTGEVSAPMLGELGVSGAILGHSERRELFGESDQALREKVVAALDAGLLPVLCVGETEAEREAGQTEDKLRRQFDLDLADLASERLPDLVIAYEPIWAIGTGKTASPEQAQETVAFVRALVAERDAGAAERIRILYGGSVKAANATELLTQPDIDGALVGGASLDAAEFAAIVAAASTPA